MTFVLLCIYEFHIFATAFVRLYFHLPYEYRNPKQYSGADSCLGRLTCPMKREVHDRVIDNQAKSGLLLNCVLSTKSVTRIAAI